MGNFDTWELTAGRSRAPREVVWVIYADHVVRVIAVSVDLLILSFFIIPAYLLLAGSGVHDAILTVGIGALVFSWLYFAVFESSRFMGTPGKMLAGIMVIDRYGRRVSFLHATGRFVCKLIAGPRSLINLRFYDAMVESSLVVRRD